MTHAHITGASVPIKLGDKLFDVSPLSDKDIAELDAYVRHVHIQTAIDAAKGQDDRIADKVINFAVMQASAITFMSPQGAAIIKSQDGVARILWHGLKHKHPDLTHEQVRALMYDPLTIREANRVFKELNVEPLAEVAAKGKALEAARLHRKKSTSRSSRGTSSRRKK
jgi:hypothetical protein